MYRKILGPLGVVGNAVLRLADNCVIPLDADGNLDAAEAAAWIAAGGQLEEASMESDISRLKSAALQEIDEFCAKLRSKLASADPIAVATWQGKADRATRFLSNVAYDEDKQILLVEAEARGRNESAEQLANLIIERSNFFVMAAARIDGFSRRSRDGVAACSTTDEVLAVLQTFRASGRALSAAFSLASDELPT